MEPHSPRKDSSRIDALLPFLWIVLFACAYFALKRGFGVLICDDAYITLSHARSWVEGAGPVMSARNPVCATSTPLYTALLALGALVSGSADFEALAYWSNAACDMAGLFFMHRMALGMRLSAPFALGAVTAYGLSVSFLAVSAFGMETPLYVALALAGTYFRFFSRRPHRGLPAVCLLAPLVRPEGALLPAVLIILGWWKGETWKRTAWYAVAAGLGLALFFGFYLHAYGHWLPHSVVAKRLEMQVGPGEAMHSWILNVFYKGPVFGGSRTVTLFNLAAVALALTGFVPRRPRIGDAMPLFPEAERLEWRSPAYLGFLLAWPCLYFLFFLATRSSYALFTWYYLPVLPFLILFLMAGMHRLSAGRVPDKAVWGVVFAMLIYVPAQTFLQRIPQKHRLAKDAREGRYLEAARWLDAEPVLGNAEVTAPLVMIDEVGALGYFSRVKILDTHGLLSPEALPFLGGTDASSALGGHWARLTILREKFKPDWIMGMRPTGEEGRPEADEAQLYEGYRLERVLRRPAHPYVVEMWKKGY